MSAPETNTDVVYDASTLAPSKRLLLGVQHLFAMFGATVLVPALTGLDVANALLFAGLGTLLFHLITGRKMPVPVLCTWSWPSSLSSSVPRRSCATFPPLSPDLSSSALV